jgi:hypothetical protein
MYMEIAIIALFASLLGLCSVALTSLSAKKSGNRSHLLLLPVLDAEFEPAEPYVPTASAPVVFLLEGRRPLLLTAPQTATAGQPAVTERPEASRRAVQAYSRQPLMPLSTRHLVG